ncbi:MAG: hypothetical protein ABW185_28480 [Sedimenticola sp.]
MAAASPTRKRFHRFCAGASLFVPASVIVRRKRTPALPTRSGFVKALAYLFVFVFVPFTGKGLLTFGAAVLVPLGCADVVTACVPENEGKQKAIL